MPNHAHFLFQSGPALVLLLMRRLLTGYAVSFNRRHRRHGAQGRAIYSKGLRKEQVEARTLFCYWAVRELGLSNTAIARKLGMSQPAVGYAVRRGEALAIERRFTLEP